MKWIGKTFAMIFSLWARGKTVDKKMKHIIVSTIGGVMILGSATLLDLQIMPNLSGALGLLGLAVVIFANLAVHEEKSLTKPQK
jgi:hypothetical protein